jgi:hypothetical protein
LDRLRPPGISLWLENEPNFWKLLTWVLGVFAVLKGVRRPGTWPLTQAEVDYSFGFTKRGLQGEIFHGLHLWNARPLGTVFVVELALLFLLLIILTSRSGLVQQGGGWCIAAAFASSYSVTYITNTIGYSEVLGAALALVTLLVRDSRLRFLVASPVIAVGILIHEDFLLLFVPFLLLSFFLDGLVEATRRRAWTAGFILSALAIALTLLTSLAPSLPPEQAHRMQASLMSKVDFPLRSEMFRIFTLSLHDNLAIMWQIGRHSYWWWTEQLVSLFVFGPVLWLIIRRCFRTLESVNQATGAIKFAVLLSSLAPLSMHLLGFDQMRWNALCVLDAYVCLLIINMHFQAANVPADRVERNIVILVIALNMASGYGLLDADVVKPYPFFPSAVKGIVARHDGARMPL